MHVVKRILATIGRPFSALRRRSIAAARRVRRSRSTLLEFAGYGLLVAAAYQVALGWALAVAGLACLIVAISPGSDES